MNTFLKKTIAMIVFLSVVLAAFSACGAFPDQAVNAVKEPEEVYVPKAPSPALSETEDSDSYYRHLLDSMTLTEKVGQLFIIRPDQADLSMRPSATHSSASRARTLTPAMRETLEKYPPGGFSLYDKNIESPEQVAKFTAEMKEVCEIEPIIAIDEEGGRVSRLAAAWRKGFKLPRYKNMASIGATGDTSKAYDAGVAIGTYLKDYGFNLDYAPVTDIYTNPQNKIIGDRAFGTTPEVVSGMAAAFADGLRSCNIMSCIKHFPGHGDTVNDTHKGYVAVEKTWEELLEVELKPFIECFDKTDMVMIAHISLVNATSDGLPASLSKELITDKLRNELGYEGIVITDSLAMKAIVKNYGSAESTLMALEAGVDILLMPEDYVASFEAILKAVETGRISEQRIDESVLKILRKKAEFGGLT